MAGKISSIRNQQLFNKAAIYVTLIIGSIIAVIPILWMISSSLKTSIGVYMLPPEWIPSEPQWRNFLEVLKQIPFFS